MNHEEMYAEFGNSLVALVRTDDDGEVNDTRDETARGMAAYDTEVLLKTMADVPYDVAAIFSGCAGVRERSLFEVRALEGEELMERLVEQRERRALPLRFVDGHRGADLFEAFLESIKGCVLYRDVAVLLARGFEDRDFKRLFPASLYKMMDRKERAKYAAETEEESADDGPEENNTLEREDDDDDSV